MDKIEKLLTIYLLWITMLSQSPSAARGKSPLRPTIFVRLHCCSILTVQLVKISDFGAQRIATEMINDLKLEIHNSAM